MSQRGLGSPYRNSACMRINMLLRWMVQDEIDLGLWQTDFIKPEKFVCHYVPPCCATGTTDGVYILSQRKLEGGHGIDSCSSPMGYKRSFEI